MNIGFQGTEGSYSQQALISCFGKNEKNIGFTTFEDVFRALKKKEINCAFLPVENSIAGSVAPVYDLLLSEDVYAISEYYFEIKHCLLVHEEVELKNIEIVYSHPVALEQCREFIFENNMKPIQKYDTAGSAELIAKTENPHKAAIASSLCAEIYGLKIIAENIASNVNNYTKFLVVVDFFGEFN